MAAWHRLQQERKQREEQQQELPLDLGVQGDQGDDEEDDNASPVAVHPAHQFQLWVIHSEDAPDRWVLVGPGENSPVPSLSTRPELQDTREFVDEAAARSFWSRFLRKGARPRERARSPEPEPPRFGEVKEEELEVPEEENKQEQPAEGKEEKKQKRRRGRPATDEKTLALLRGDRWVSEQTEPVSRFIPLARVFQWSFNPAINAEVPTINDILHARWNANQGRTDWLK